MQEYIPLGSIYRYVNIAGVHRLPFYCNCTENYVTTAERTPSERMKHSNTAVVHLAQGRVDSRRAEAGN